MRANGIRGSNRGDWADVHSTWAKRLGAGTRWPAWLLQAQHAPAGCRRTPVGSAR